jgi:demethylmenaquinone methyltransferase / 2-methoxy-6-polyprenyl-1,4-benzoquinol methylase
MTLDKSAARIQEMFGQIAGRYDLLNRLLSLGIDRSWRRRTVKLVPPIGDAPILDVCTGTADLALAYWRAAKASLAIVATDFCRPMLAIAQEKCRRADALASDSVPLLRRSIPRSHALRGNAPSDAPRPFNEPTPSVESDVPTQSVGTSEHVEAGITLLEADTLRLPFPDDTFQIVSVAFGLRNVADTDAGLREMVRVCQQSGRVAVLEFSAPTLWPFRPIYAWYFQHVLPRIGQALARNRQAAYNYLPQSVGRFPRGEALAERMRAAGLAEVWRRSFTFGVATLYVGTKAGG